MLNTPNGDKKLKFFSTKSRISNKTYDVTALHFTLPLCKLQFKSADYFMPFQDNWYRHIYIYTSNFCQVRNILWRNMIHRAWVDEWLGHGLFIIDKTLMPLVYARYPHHVLGCLDVCPRTDVSSVCLLHLYICSGFLW